MTEWSGHEPSPGLSGTIGRCEICDKTVNGSLAAHMVAAHAGETLNCWSDPDTGTWTVFGYGDPDVWSERIEGE